jgi:type II secretion system protein I
MRIYWSIGVGGQLEEPIMQLATKQRGRPQERRRGSQEHGFTLLETSVALVILMIAALGSVSVFAYSVRNNSAAQDRELAMGVAQHALEQLRDVPFTDASLTATAGTTSTVTRAGREYRIVTVIADEVVVNGQPTIKTITVQVTPQSGALGSVTLRTQRVTLLGGPYR